MVFVILFIVAVYIVQGVFWGNATQKVIYNKGYYDNWFWPGFFFGIIAFVAAIVKPAHSIYYEDTLLYKWSEEDIFKNNGWKCAFCQSVNENIVSTCACGKGRAESEKYLKMQYNAKIKEMAEQDITSLLKQYKWLMDNGIITQAEFEAKKKELLSQEN